MRPQVGALGVLGFGLAAGLAGQTSGESLTIGGFVVNSATGEPIQRALVRAMRLDSPEPPRPGVRFVEPKPFTATTFSDIAGAFRFAALAPGSYQLTSVKPQFIEHSGWNEPGKINLTASVEGVTIQLAPLGVITGK